MWKYLARYKIARRLTFSTFSRSFKQIVSFLFFDCLFRFKAKAMINYYYHLKKTYTDCNSKVWFHIEVRYTIISSKYVIYANTPFCLVIKVINYEIKSHRINCILLLFSIFLFLNVNLF